ncbi:hypothetical protein HYU19_02625 [Candidatus Woesearchaeota archaeon]|nr:hypothetical protein [Candidatus Woesearchaeota archaeon]
MTRHLGDHLKVAVILLLIAAVAYNLFSGEKLFQFPGHAVTGTTTSDVPVAAADKPALTADQAFTAVISVLVLLLIGMGGYYFRSRNSTNATVSGGMGNISGDAVAVDKDMLFYVGEARKVGYRDEQIQARLQRAGWAKKEIAAAFDATKRLK